MVFGALIIFFLIVEPHGLARLWQIGKEKLRLWPFPTEPFNSRPRRTHDDETKHALIGLLTRRSPAGPLAWPALAQAKESFVPLLVYRTGPVRAERHPDRQRLHRLLHALNERDGGINGVKVAWEECETQYDTKQGVECYERLKGKSGGAAWSIPTAPASRTSSSPRRRSTRSRCSRWATA